MFGRFCLEDTKFLLKPCWRVRELALIDDPFLAFEYEWHTATCMQSSVNAWLRRWQRRRWCLYSQASNGDFCPRSLQQSSIISTSCHSEVPKSMDLNVFASVLALVSTILNNSILCHIAPLYVPVCCNISWKHKHAHTRAHAHKVLYSTPIISVQFIPGGFAMLLPAHFRLSMPSTSALPALCPWLFLFVPGRFPPC